MGHADGTGRIAPRLGVERAQDGCHDIGPGSPVFGDWQIDQRLTLWHLDHALVDQAVRDDRDEGRPRRPWHDAQARGLTSGVGVAVERQVEGVRCGRTVRGREPSRPEIERGRGIAAIRGFHDHLVEAPIDRCGHQMRGPAGQGDNL